MRIRLSVIALLTTTALATAADLPLRTPAPAPAPVPAPIFTSVTTDWSGFYVGVAASARRTASTTGLTAANYALTTQGLGGAGNTVTQTNTTVAAVKAKAINAFGGGLFTGYNIQSGSFVYGVEADANYTLDRTNASALGGRNISGAYADTASTNDTLSATGALAVTSKSRLNWDGSMRLRAGVLAAPSLLVFATGGLAVGQTQRTTTTTGSIAYKDEDTTSIQATHRIAGVSDVKKISLGWTVGGGIDYRLTDAWTLRADYRYTDFGKTTVAGSTAATCTATVTGACATLVPANATSSTTYHDKFHAVRLGASYQFGGSMSPQAILARY